MTRPLSRGCAAFGAGIGPCGHSPDDEPSDKVVQPRVSAIAFDPYDRVWSQNDDLTMKETSGPIQRAATLMLPLGAIPAVGRNGIDVKRIKRALPEQRLRVIRDELQLAWKTLLDTRQIAIANVTLSDTTPWDGRFFVDVRDIVSPKLSRTLEGKA